MLLLVRLSSKAERLEVHLSYSAAEIWTRSGNFSHRKKMRWLSIQSLLSSASAIRSNVCSRKTKIIRISIHAKLQ